MLTLTQSGVTDIGYVPPSFVTDKMPLSAVAELPTNFTESCQGTMAYFKLAHAGGILDKNEFAPAGIRLLFTIVLPPYKVFLGKKKRSEALREGKRVYVSVALGGRRIQKKNT